MAALKSKDGDLDAVISAFVWYDKHHPDNHQKSKVLGGVYKRKPDKGFYSNQDNIQRLTEVLKTYHKHPSAMNFCTDWLVVAAIFFSAKNKTLSYNKKRVYNLYRKNKVLIDKGLKSTAHDNDVEEGALSDIVSEAQEADGDKQQSQHSSHAKRNQNQLENESEKENEVHYHDISSHTRLIHNVSSVNIEDRHERNSSTDKEESNCSESDKLIRNANNKSKIKQSGITENHGTSTSHNVSPSNMSNFGNNCKNAQWDGQLDEDLLSNFGGKTDQERSGKYERKSNISSANVYLGPRNESEEAEIANSMDINAAELSEKEQTKYSEMFEYEEEKDGENRSPYLSENGINSEGNEEEYSKDNVAGTEENDEYVPNATQNKRGNLQNSSRDKEKKVQKCRNLRKPHRSDNQPMEELSSDTEAEDTCSSDLHSSSEEDMSSSVHQKSIAFDKQEAKYVSIILDGILKSWRKDRRKLIFTSKMHDKEVKRMRGSSPADEDIWVQPVTTDSELGGRFPYPETVVQSLTRSRKSKTGEFSAVITNRKHCIKLPDEWKRIPVIERKTHRKFGGDYANFFSDLLAPFNQYCTFRFTYNHIKREGTRKQSEPFFHGKGNCAFHKDGCPFKFDITIKKPDDNYMKVLFIGDIYHPGGRLKARKFTGKKKENIKEFFRKNPSGQPSKLWRDKLASTPSKSFTSGNMTGAGVTGTPFQRLSSLAKRDATSCETISNEINNLKLQLAKQDESEAIKNAHFFRKKFGFIQKYNISYDDIEIIMMDEPEIYLWHHCPKYIHIDATGTVAAPLKWAKKLLYYAVVIQNPYGKTPPVPICEFLSSNHDQFAIARFLREIIEGEHRTFGKITSPRLITVDFSWAIILAACDVFCKEQIRQYLDRMYDIIHGQTTKTDLSKPIIHVCAAHMMKLCKTHALVSCEQSSNSGSQVHFALRFFGRLINCNNLEDATNLIRSAYIIFSSQNESIKTDDALSHIAESINTFAEIVPDYLEISESKFKEPETKEDSENASTFSECSEDHINNTKFKTHWDKVIGSMVSIQENDDSLRSSPNKYYMPDFFVWLQSKLAYIALWSNICLGDLSRFNSDYKEICSSEGEYIVCDERKTNATIEEFFTVKKQDTQKLKLPVKDFVKMCYEDNKGLRRQFINRVETAGSSEIGSTRDQIQKQKHLLANIKVLLHRQSVDDDDFSEPETPKSHIHTESWNKKENKHRNKRKISGRYTSAPDTPLNFTLGKKTSSEPKTDAAAGTGDSTPQEYSTPKEKGKRVSSAGYTIFQRKLLREMTKPISKPMSEIKKELKRQWNNLDLSEQSKYSRMSQSGNDICQLCNFDPNTTCARFPRTDWVQCDFCNEWYHLNCLMIDYAYADSVEYFSCTVCAKKFSNNMDSYFYHCQTAFSFGQMNVIRKLIDTWGSLSKESKDRIQAHNFYYHGKPSYKALLPMEIIGNRGIRNPYNNCWLNSVIQLLCSTNIYSLIPSVNICDTAVLRDLRKIACHLQSTTSHGPVNYSNEMNRIGVAIMDTDQKKEREQNDAELFLTNICAHILNESIDNLSQQFYHKLIHFSSCVECGAVVGTCSESATLRLLIYDKGYDSVSIQSLLWEFCRSQSFVTISDCACGDGKVKEFSSSYFIHAPAILMLTLDRVEPGTVIVDHCPIELSKTLDLRHLMANTIAENCTEYVLAGCINFWGKKAKSGHYNCTMFDGHDNAVVFDDTNLRTTTLNSFLKSKRSKESAYVLLYVRQDMDGIDRRKDAPWNHLTINDAETIEQIWFDLVTFPHKEDNLSRSDFLRLQSNQKLNDKVINAYFRSLDNEKFDLDRLEKTELHVRCISSYITTTLLEERVDSPLLSNVINDPILFLGNDLILLPFHHVDIDHWSTIGIYPKHKMVVHCDSLPHPKQDTVAFALTAKFIATAISTEGRDGYLDLSRWKFIPLHRFWLPKQNDTTKCGIYACIFAYSLATLIDYDVELPEMTNIRYWIANNALNGALKQNYFSSNCVHKEIKYADVKKIHADTDLPDKHKTEKKPFASLKDYLYFRKVEVQNMNDFPYDIYRFYKAETESESDEDISSEASEDDGRMRRNMSPIDVKEEAKHQVLEDEFEEEFQEFVKKNLDHYHSKMNRLYSLQLGMISERMAALRRIKANSDRKKFKSAAFEEYLILRNVLGKNHYDRLFDIVRDAYTVYKENTDEDLFALRKLVYDFKVHVLCRLSRYDIIQYVVFPEMLTEFLMKRDGKTQKEATDYLHGTVENGNLLRDLFSDIEH